MSRLAQFLVVGLVLSGLALGVGGGGNWVILLGVEPRVLLGHVLGLWSHELAGVAGLGQQLLRVPVGVVVQKVGLEGL